MMRRLPVIGSAILLLISAAVVGCAPTPATKSLANSTAVEGHEHGHDDHDHDHGHSHAALGPHGGHLLELGAEQFHAEWVHDESGKLTVYILDGAAKELVPIAADRLTIDKKVGERTDRFEVTAVDRQGETPKSAKFAIADKSLVEALKLVGDGVEATLTVDVNGQSFTGAFAKHEGGHGHKH